MGEICLQIKVNVVAIDWKPTMFSMLGLDKVRHYLDYMVSFVILHGFSPLKDEVEESE